MMQQEKTAVGTAAQENKLEEHKDISSSLNGKAPIYNAAIALLKKGYSVGITSKEKFPVLQSWKTFQTIQATQEEITDQILHPNAFGICIFTGYNNYEVIDIDLKYDLTGTLYERLVNEIEKQLPGLLKKLTIIKTQSGGYHFGYRCETIEGNQKLAKRPATDVEKQTRPDERFKGLIETRGLRGLVVTAPTPGYVSVQKNEPPLLTIYERETLLSICRSFNEVFEEQKVAFTNKESASVYELTPWDDFDQRGDVVPILERSGWKIDHRTGNKIRWTRPGKNSGTSAEWDESKRRFYVFTSSSEFEMEHGYTATSIFKILACDKDASKACKELEAAGYGKRLPRDESKKTQSTIDIVSLIEHLHNNYNFKRNEINRRIELNGREMQQKDFNSVYLEEKKVFPRLNYDLLERAINSDYTPCYNPLKDFIEANKHREPQGNLIALAETIKTDTGFDGSEFFPDYVLHFVRKWFVSIIASIHGEHSPQMLVLCGSRQGTGKTEWLRRLLPRELKNFYAESKLDAGKDDEILMCQKLLISDDEFGGKSKKDEKRIKEILSKDYFTLREPYGRHNVDLKRLAVLCGTTNDNEILSDPTGNRRIIPINVLEINKEAYNSINKTDLFIESYHLYKSGFEWRLTSDDIRDLNKNTSSFEQTSIERELVLTTFKLPKMENDPYSEFLTTAQIKDRIETATNQKMNLTRLGIELKKMIGTDKVAKKVNGQVIRGYYLIDKSKSVVGLSDGC